MKSYWNSTATVHLGTITAILSIRTRAIPKLYPGTRTIRARREGRNQRNYISYRYGRGSTGDAQGQHSTTRERQKGEGPASQILWL